MAVKSSKIKLKSFIIEVEGLMPVKITYKIQAENEDQAFENYRSKPHTLQPQHAPKLLSGNIIPKQINIREISSMFTRWVRKL